MKLHLSNKRRVSLGTLIGVVILVAFLSYKMGTSQRAVLPSGDNLSSLKEQLTTLQTSNEELRKELIYAERNYHIQVEAKRNLGEHLKSLQQHNAELMQNMTLYQTVTGTQLTKQSVKIKAFQVHPAGAKNTFRYLVVLSKEMSGRELIQGGVAMTIVGKIGDQPILLPVKYVNSGRRDGLAFKFRHFQELSGELSFPEQFIPEEVLFKIRPDKGGAFLEQKLPWSLIG